jgi:hypothetical protein
MLGVSKDTVTDVLRSIEALVWYVNYDYLNSHQNGGVTVEVGAVNEVDMGVLPVIHPISTGFSGQ